MDFTLELLRSLLGWTLLLNLILLLFWSSMIKFAGDFVYKVHTAFIPLSRDQFHMAHYVSLAIYKLMLSLFVLMPWLALHIML